MVAYGIDRRYRVNRKHIGHMWFDKDLIFVCLILEFLNVFCKQKLSLGYVAFQEKTPECVHTGFLVVLSQVTTSLT